MAPLFVEGSHAGRMKQSFRFRKDSGLPITESAFSDNGSLTWSALAGKHGRRGATRRPLQISFRIFESTWSPASYK